MPYWLCDCLGLLGHHQMFQEFPLVHIASSSWIRGSLKGNCNPVNEVSCFILLFLKLQLQLEGDSPSQSPRLWPRAPHAWGLMTLFGIRVAEGWEDCEKLSFTVAPLHRVLSNIIWWGVAFWGCCVWCWRWANPCITLYRRNIKALWRRRPNKQSF